jgi:hypothetical protein
MLPIALLLLPIGAWSQLAPGYGQGADSLPSNSSIAQGMQDMMQIMRQMASGASAAQGAAPGSSYYGGGLSPAHPPPFGWSPSQWYGQGMQMWPTMAEKWRRGWGAGSWPMGAPWSGTYPGGAFAGASPLEGTWESSTGELMIVSGGQFEIRSADQRSASGSLSVQGNQLYTYSPDLGVGQEYEFALEGDKLALRDPDGDLLLFRRLSPNSGPAWGSWPGQPSPYYP